jgi:hypothetical protein
MEFGDTLMTLVKNRDVFACKAVLHRSPRQIDPEILAWNS